MLKELSVIHFVAAVLACVGIVLCADRSARADEPSDAFGFYLEFLKTSAEAEDIGEIAPFMPIWWRGRYEAADEATQASAFEWKVKLARDLRAVTLEKEESLDIGVRLHMTAKEQNDFPMRGEVLLGRGQDGFVIEEETWTTSQ